MFAPLLEKAQSRENASLTRSEQKPGRAPATAHAAASAAPWRFSEIPVFAPTRANSQSSLSPPRFMQRKIAVGQINDPLEHEADRVADQVMHAEPTGTNVLQAKPAHQSGTGGSEAPPVVHNVLHSPGRQLDASVRGFFEPRFGHDLSGIRIHDDSAAADSASSVDALAYTVGNHIAFARGQYNPASTPGRRLIAHELAHTVQQGAAQTAHRMLQRTPAKPDPRKFVTETVVEPRHIRKSEYLAGQDAHGTPTLTEEYWVDFEVDAKGTMTASVRTVSPDRAFRSANLRFGDEFGRALEHFDQTGVQVNSFEGDWSYMTKDEISDNLKAFKEGIGPENPEKRPLTREQAAAETPSGKVARKHGFKVTNVENVPEQQEHLAEEGVSRWRVKATFQRTQTAPPIAPKAPAAPAAPKAPTSKVPPSGGKTGAAVEHPPAPPETKPTPRTAPVERPPASVPKGASLGEALFGLAEIAGYILFGLQAKSDFEQGDYVGGGLNTAAALGSEVAAPLAIGYEGTKAAAELAGWEGQCRVLVTKFETCQISDRELQDLAKSCPPIMIGTEEVQRVLNALFNDEFPSQCE
jgi:hypothetical protein